MNQHQSEALLGLIILSIFTDSILSLKEDDALNAALEAVEWKSPKPRDIFILTTMSQARRAGESDSGILAFIQEKAAAFTEAADQDFVLKMLQAVFQSDGLVDSEAAFLARVKTAFPG